MMLTYLRSGAIAICAGFFFSGCMHTAEEKRKAEVEHAAAERIETMEKNIVKAQATKNQQLEGQPRESLAKAIDDLRRVTEEAKSELKELEARDTTTWLDKKVKVDAKLAEMDKTYDSTLSLISAH